MEFTSNYLLMRIYYYLLKINCACKETRFDMTQIVGAVELSTEDAFSVCKEKRRLCARVGGGGGGLQEIPLSIL